MLHVLLSVFTILVFNSNILIVLAGRDGKLRMLALKLVSSVRLHVPQESPKITSHTGNISTHTATLTDKTLVFVGPFEMLY